MNQHELAKILNKIEPVKLYDMHKVYPNITMFDNWKWLHYGYVAASDPTTLGNDEFLFFERLITVLRPKQMLIIGNGMGLSTAFIYQKMMENGGEKLFVIENKSQGAGELCFNTSRKFFDELGCENLILHEGSSPEDLDFITGKLDIIFIDGNHRWLYPYKDFLGVQPYAREDTLFLWHDFRFPGVSMSVKQAHLEGHICKGARTSGSMAMSSRDADVINAAGQVMDGVLATDIEP